MRSSRPIKKRRTIPEIALQGENKNSLTIFLIAAIGASLLSASTSAALAASAEQAPMAQEQRDQESAESLRKRGLAEMVPGQYDLAVKDFSSALEIKPNYVDALYNRGLAYLNLGNIASAEADFRHALEIAPESVNALFGYGQTLWNEQRYEEAITAYDEVIRRKPAVIYQLALTFRGRAYVALGDDSKALLSFEQSIREFPHFADAYDQRGLIRERRGDLNGAFADFNLAVAYNPGFADYRKHLVDLERKLGSAPETK
jgi:tetratricopeptide (TPR) repeat protein